MRLVHEMKLENSDVLMLNRMYRNSPLAIGDHVFAITSIEICGF